jgi:RNA polymerase sigma-B factor
MREVGVRGPGYGRPVRLVAKPVASPPDLGDWDSMTTTASLPQHTFTRPETVRGPRDRQSAEIDDLLRTAAESEEPRRTQLHERAIVLGVPMARTLASRYRYRGVDTDDLIQVANVGLVKAVNGYIPGPDTDFRSYAMPTILGEIRRHFRDSAWMVRPPRRIQDLQIAINGIDSQLTAKLNRCPTREDLAEALDVPIEQIVDAQSAQGCFRPLSLDAKLPTSSSLSLADLFPDETDTYRLVDHLEVLRTAVAELPARDRLILSRRFVDHRTQAEIGQEIGVGQRHVSRLLRRILLVLGSALQAAR